MVLNLLGENRGVLFQDQGDEVGCRLSPQKITQLYMYTKILI